jgi:uncharacterized protein (TIGR02270 family)
MPYTPPEPRWDIVEEHLNEAEFLWGMWEHGLRSARYTLGALARGPERRLLAHHDGLLANGPEVAPRLLIPALACDAPDRVSAAAATLLASPEPAGAAAVFDAWYALPARRPALARALACAERPDLLPLLRAQLADPAQLLATAELLVARGEPLGPALAHLLASDEPAARALALRALPDAPEPELLDAAITAGVRLGLELAWARAQDRAQERHGGAALLLLALRNAPADRAILLAAAARPKRRAAALWALGFLGTPEVVDASIEFLEDPGVGHLAGEVFTAVTGVDLLAAGLATPRVERVALAFTPEDELPRADPVAALQWWIRHRGDFRDGQRYLAGAPYSLSAVRDALEHAPMRRRPTHLLDLQLHAASHRPRLEPRAPTRRQRAQLAVLRALPLA